MNEIRNIIQADYTTFLHDLGSRIGDKGVWPRHTAGPWAHYTGNQICQDGNFCKPNVTAGDPKRRSIHPTVTNIWTSTADGTVGSDGSRPVK